MPSAATAEIKQAKPERIYRMLEAKYGLKKGDQRTAKGLSLHGVVPALLIQRGYAELVNDVHHVARHDQA